MAAKSIQLGSFCGGSSRLKDSAFLGFEESVNMYTETVKATDSYTQKMLKSLEGFSRFTDFNFPAIYDIDSNKKADKFFVASKSPASSPNGGDPVIYTVVNNRIWRIYKDGSVGLVSKEFYDGLNSYNLEGGVEFAETSGDPSYLIIIGRFDIPGQSGTNIAKMFAVSLEADDIDPYGESYGQIDSIDLPDAYDHDGKVKPTCVTSLNYRLVINDEGHDYIYWSELNKPNGVDNSHAFAQKLTQYAYTKTDGTAVTYDDNVYYPPAYGTYVDGTLVSRTRWMSALNNVKADFRADNVKSIISADTSLFVFGSTSYQLYKWQNSQYTPFITSSKTSQIGLRSPGTLSAMDNSVYFLGSGPVGANAVFSVSESGLNRISNNAIEQRISAVHEQDKSYAFTYSYKGHSFYVLTFYGERDNFTVCYDVTEGEWHDRCTLDDAGNENYWEPRCAAEVYGNVLFSFDNKPQLYSLSINSFIDSNGRPLVRKRTTGIKFDNFNDVILRSLEIVTENGAVTTAGVDPRIMLQVSFDGGYTWSQELWNKAGRVGRYNFRTIWRNLGKGPKVAFRIKMTDPAPFSIATAMLEYSSCGNRIG